MEANISELEFKESGSLPLTYITGQDMQLLSSAAAALNPEDCHMFRSLLAKVNHVVDQNCAALGHPGVTPAGQQRQLDPVEQAQHELDKAFEEAKGRHSPAAVVNADSAASAANDLPDTRMTPSRRRAHSLGGSPIRELRFRSSEMSELVSTYHPTGGLRLKQKTAPTCHPESDPYLIHHVVAAQQNAAKGDEGVVTPTKKE